MTVAPEPPRNPAAEAETLGALLLDPQAADTALAILRAEDFYSTAHRQIFAAAKTVRESGPIDMALVRQELERRGELKSSGGAGYLAELLAACPTSAHAELYARAVLEASVRRTLERDCTRAQHEARDPGQSIDAVLEIFSRALVAANQRWGGGIGDTSIAAVLKDLFAELDDPDRDKRPALLTFGLPPLDAIVGGLAPGEFCLLAGRPSCGKSTFALQTAHYWARYRPVGFFSYEMGKKQIAWGILSSLARVAIRKDGSYDGDYADRIATAMGEAAGLRLYVDDTSPRLGALLARCRDLYNRHGCRAFFVDYLQLVKPDKTREVREQEVAAISRALKLLAGELSVPVIACAQLNRAGTTDGVKPSRPRLSNLRESGALEQDADVVIFLHDPAGWNQDGKRPAEGSAELIVAKNRSGETGLCHLLWQRGYRIFEEEVSPYEDKF